MPQTMRSPRITHISWGRMEVAGVGEGKDFKLWPGGGREWDWSETNTRHVPGIQPSDVEELLARGSRTVVLTRGMHLVLQTCPETLRLLEERGVRVHVEETRAAVELYNRLAETEPVGGVVPLHLLTSLWRRSSCQELSGGGVYVVCEAGGLQICSASVSWGGTHAPTRKVSYVAQLDRQVLA
jgi:hypothetical protein